jgi:hypothetical protein
MLLTDARFPRYEFKMKMSSPKRVFLHQALHEAPGKEHKRGSRKKKVGNHPPPQRFNYNLSDGPNMQLEGEFRRWRQNIAF